MKLVQAFRPLCVESNRDFRRSVRKKCQILGCAGKMRNCSCPSATFRLSEIRIRLRADIRAAASPRGPFRQGSLLKSHPHPNRTEKRTAQSERRHVTAYSGAPNSSAWKSLLHCLPDCSEKASISLFRCSTKRPPIPNHLPEWKGCSADSHFGKVFSKYKGFKKRQKYYIKIKNNLF